MSNEPLYNVGLYNILYMFIDTYDSNLFWDHKWWSSQWRASLTKITKINSSAFPYRLFYEDFSSTRRAKSEINLSAFAYRLFHEDFSLILGAKWTFCSED